MTDGANFVENMHNYDMPARKAILQYLVRMGSFTSAPKIPNEDKGDEDAILPVLAEWTQMQSLCLEKLANLPPNLPRHLSRGYPLHGTDTDGLNILLEKYEGSIRVMQWNILGQGLADGCDVFTRCPRDALDWSVRRWRILLEIVSKQPDIICLQEVDHFKFLNRALTSLGYTGTFFPKPDSPCLYIDGNNGPDGCAIFVNWSFFEVIEKKTRVLEICSCQTNQVAIFLKLRRRIDDAELWVVTTHLKAKQGVFMESLRKEQGSDLVNYLKCFATNTPVLLCGDFNANPSERVHDVLKDAGLVSAYRKDETPWTTWTVRDTGECVGTLDYIFYSKGDFIVERKLPMPSEEEIGIERVPSHQYPSDHFSLVVDLFFTNINVK